MGICDRLGLPSTDDQQARQKADIVPVVRDRIEKKREQERRAAEFRSVVWKHAKSHCEVCGRKVTRSTSSTIRGHVHHRRGRNVAPEDRFNPAKAVLLCALCHAQVHQGTLKV